MRTKRISADEARTARKDLMQAGPDGRERMVRVASAPASWDAKARSARFVMTSESVDRYGDVVVTAGLDTTEFEKNPQAFLNHKSANWPIGTWANVKKVRSQPPRMEGDLVLHPQGGPIPEIDQAAFMIANGGLRASSIGFLPDFNEIEMILAEDGSWTGGLMFHQGELLECSLCGIPANPDALAKSIDQNIGFAREVLDYALDNFARGADGAMIERKAFENLYRIIGKDEQPAVEIDKVLAGMDAPAAVAVCERFLATKNLLTVSRDRSEAIERAARNKRLQDKRTRDLALIKARAL